MKKALGLKYKEQEVTHQLPPWKNRLKEGDQYDTINSLEQQTLEVK